MAGKFSIYKYAKLAWKGWRYARAAYHPNGKIKPDIVLVKGVNGKDVGEKHPEGSYVLNFNNKWIPVDEDALKAQHQRKLKLDEVEYERLRGKTLASGPNVVQLGRKVIKDEVDAYLANLELAKRPYKTVGEKLRFLTSFLTIVPKKFVGEFSRNHVLVSPWHERREPGVRAWLRLCESEQLCELGVEHPHRKKSGQSPVLETLRNDRVACLRLRRAECHVDGFAQTLRG